MSKTTWMMLEFLKLVLFAQLSLAIILFLLPLFSGRFDVYGLGTIALTAGIAYFGYRWATLEQKKKSK